MQCSSRMAHYNISVSHVSFIFFTVRYTLRSKKSPCSANPQLSTTPRVLTQEIRSIVIRHHTLNPSYWCSHQINYPKKKSVCRQLSVCLLLFGKHPHYSVTAPKVLFFRLTAQNERVNWSEFLRRDTNICLIRRRLVFGDVTSFCLEKAT